MHRARLYKAEQRLMKSSELNGKKLAEINFVSHKRAPQYSYTYPFREFAGSSVKNLPAVQETWVQFLG